jgi:hypothetical protein
MPKSRPASGRFSQRIHHHSSKRQSSQPLKKRTNKVFKRSASQKSKKRGSSSFLRIFFSGVMLALGVGILSLFFLLKQSDLALDESLSIYYHQPSVQGQQAFIFSLRGNDKEVVVFPIVPPRSVESKAVLTAQTGILTQKEVSSTEQGRITADPTIGELRELFFPFSKKQLLGELKWMDKLRVWWYLTKLDPSKFVVLKSANGSDYPGSLPLVQKYLNDSRLRKTAPTIAIINTTDTSKLARRYADILAGVGYSVVHISTNAEMTEEHTQLFVNDNSFQLNSWEVELLKAVLPQSSVVTGDVARAEEYRSQMVLFLGNDVTGLLDSW